MQKVVLSAVLLLALSSGLSMANECKIEEITPSKQESNDFTFQTFLQKNLSVYTAKPEKALLSYDGVTYIYDKDNLISFRTVREKFKKSETIEKTIKDFYFNDCSKPIIRINKLNFDVLIINNHLDEKQRAIAFILDKTDDSYFYLLSFVGFSQDQAIKMLIRK